MSFFLSVGNVRRCYYSMARAVFEPAPFPNAKRWLFVSDIGLWIYSCRMLYIMYLWRDDFKNTHYDLHYDLVTYWVSYHKDSYDSYYMVVVWLLETFNFYCQFSFYFLDRQTITWVWWHELIVVNQDEYRNCLLNKNQLDSVLAKKLGISISNLKKLFYNCHVCSAKHFKHLLFAKTKILIFFTLENIDQKRFFKKPLKVLPLLSRKVRSQALLFCILTDHLMHIAQICYCKYFKQLKTVFPYSLDITNTHI